MTIAAATRVDLLFRAFADPIRIRILRLLQPGELCVCDLVDVLKLPQPTISRHLAYLRRSDLVNVREEASWNYYSLAPASSALQEKLLECLESSAREIPEMAADARRANAVRKRGGRCPA